MQISGINVEGKPGQGVDRFKIVVSHVGRVPIYAVTGDVFTAAVFVYHDFNTGKAVVLMVDGNHGASITNSAAEIIAFVQRLHIGRRGIRWRNVRWLYRDSSGYQWDEIVVTEWDGTNAAQVGFKPLANRTLDAALAVAEEAGFLLDAHERAHLQRTVENACA